MLEFTAWALIQIAVNFWVASAPWGWKCHSKFPVPVLREQGAPPEREGLRMAAVSAPAAITSFCFVLRWGEGLFLMGSTQWHEVSKCSFTRVASVQTVWKQTVRIWGEGNPLGQPHRGATAPRGTPATAQGLWSGSGGQRIPSLIWVCKSGVTLSL